jgi:alpha,alpha-trehalase
MTFPLFTGIATPDQARGVAAALAPLIGEGGVRTTLVASGQQWDDPNGWAPLQWTAITGLRRYGLVAPAERIKAGWLATVEREYAASGKLLEKYDVTERKPGGGGEYPTQDGFGWTNGVTRALLAES